MDRVVILSLADQGDCTSPRVPVLRCRDALRSAGMAVETVTAGSDPEIDAALDALSAAGTPAASEAAPEAASATGLVLASAADGQVRAVLRRLVRRHAPPPGRRPDDLPNDRTVRDLPALGLLPLVPADPGLIGRLGLPTDPEAVAKAILDGRSRAFDLLRTDAGSVTLDGALLGGSDAAGRAVRFQARVDVDDAVLSEGSEPLLAVAVLNADGYSMVDGLPMAPGTDPADGVLDVAVAIPRTRGRLRPRVEVEVRRARGRAVAITPRDEVPLLDDGVAGTLNRKRTWWMERGCWRVYTG